jgi:hypothetical protein|tara:strand:+ start:727 stop:879 length:153 start_codon:yes stop_codon:yes gene_type:complete
MNKTQLLIEELCKQRNDALDELAMAKAELAMLKAEAEAPEPAPPPLREGQ